MWLCQMRYRKAMSCIGILLVIVSFIGVEAMPADFTYRQLVYQKDMSELCRRRVIPSVFLGSRTVDANSQILHFSRLDMPYSCYISVRAEMGSNIIVVIQVASDNDFSESCKRGERQFSIHEMGETFGGYWGQMPDSVMKQDKKKENYRRYTLRSSPIPSPVIMTIRTTEVQTVTEISSEGKPHKTKEDEQYLSVELPIVNISAILVPGKFAMISSFTTDDNFDVVYDVTPRPGVKYETKIVPLLEFGVNNENSGRQGKVEMNEFNSERQLHFNNIFTPDPRLPLPELGKPTYKRKSFKYLFDVNKRLDFKKTKKLFDAKQVSLNRKSITTNWRPHFNTVQPNSYLLKLNAITHPLPNVSDENEKPHNYWNAINDILKNLTKYSEVSTQPPHKELANILRGISNKDLNKSLYLNPDLSYQDMEISIDNSTNVVSNITTGQPSSDRPNYFNEQNDVSIDTHIILDFNELINKSTAMLNNDSTNNSSVNNVSILPLGLGTIINVLKQNIVDEEKSLSSTMSLDASVATTSTKRLEPLTLSLVDHESWENVVKSAPVMAVKLNQTVTYDVLGAKNVLNTTKSTTRKMRRKRYLHAIGIEEAQPHHSHQTKHVTTTLQPEKFNVREFQRLIELKDDEIHDRVALRYMKQYMGPPLLDSCTLNDTSTRHVFLFNSSRLVFRISKFTLKGMTVVVTAARTLLDGNSRCTAANLECQISGARVCIDSLSACDGIPNCGSYDIYDEDRLSCGGSPGFSHNMCLAAVTFLVVLITLLYIIHYWLKRCVPWVSDAFFIYTDATENILYLDTIMRSPHDMGEDKNFYHSVQDLLEYEEKTEAENACIKIINRFLIFLHLKKAKPLLEVDDKIHKLYPERLLNYTEIELNKIPGAVPCVTEVAVQTGSSLQMTQLNISPNFSRDNNLGDDLENPSLEDDLGSNQPLDELGILQYLRRHRARSVSMQQGSIDYSLKYISLLSSITNKEKEISHDVLYGLDLSNIDQNEIVQQPSDITSADKVDKLAVKRLRFQDEKLIVPAASNELEDEVIENMPVNSRRSIVFGMSKTNRLQESNEFSQQGDEPGVSGRELKSYFNWGNSKKKKEKKPKKK